MEWLSVVSTAYAADVMGVASEVRGMSLGFKALVAIAVGLIILWRGAGVMSGHSREIAEVFITLFAGLALVFVVAPWAEARVAAGATAVAIPMAAQQMSDLVSMLLIAVPQWALGVKVWLKIRRRHA